MRGKSSLHKLFMIFVSQSMCFFCYKSPFLDFFGFEHHEGTVGNLEGVLQFQQTMGVVAFGDVGIEYCLDLFD